jgi:peptidoglycan/LPS O-acetylase OafA/YrhL
MRTDKTSKPSGADQISLMLDFLRGIALCCVIVENWLLFVPRASPILVLSKGVDIVQVVAGTMVHLFFILSGYGLTLSYYKSGSFAWPEWTKKRFVRVVFPYLVIVVLTFLLVTMLHGLSPYLFTMSYSWMTLLVYLTFLRNFYSTGSGFNPTLWFMPVIIGLYALFPLLLMVIRKKGPRALLVISAVLTYVSITFSLFLGYPVTHDTALPLFFIIEFALGMVLAWAVTHNEGSIKDLVTLKVFSLGMFFYVLSWVVTKLWVLGDMYNDFLTATGVLLITLYLCDLLIQISGVHVVSALRRLNKQSYVMYLLHGTLILFVAKPLLERAGLLPLNSLVSLVCAILYCAAIFLLASLIARPLNYVSGLLFRTMLRKDLADTATIRG